MPERQVMMTDASQPSLLNRTTFSTSRALDFFNEKEFVAQTGAPKEAWPPVVAKELIDNSLDACEEAGITPEIEVTVDDDGITMRDNGPGIQPETVEGVLDFSVRVSSREAYVAPDRGTQGNALKTIVSMPYVLDGREGYLRVGARGIRHDITIGLDSVRQEPRISHKQVPDEGAANGTFTTVFWPDSACSILLESKRRFLQIADDYTFLNPHLTLEVDWFGEHEAIKATAPEWRKWRPCEPTSPHWYRLEHLERLVAAYVAHDADKGRDRLVREFVGEFRGLTGSAKGKVVLEKTGLARTKLSELATAEGLNTSKLRDLLAAMQAHSKPVKPPKLGIIGRAHMQERLESLGCEMESFDYKKRAGELDGLPWLIETAFGWCPEVDRRRLVTGVNWSPGIVNPFRQLGKWGRSLDTVLTQQRGTEREPIVLVLHMACPRVSYTDRGKSAVIVE
jgi:DNA topoisomerase VI subunit B